MADYTRLTNLEVTGELKAKSISVDGAEMTQGAAVADAAGSAPTAAEFKALLDSLRNAGIIAKT